MSKEALKLALDLATMHHTDDGYAELRAKVRSATKEALAQPEQAICDLAEDGVCETLDCPNHPPKRTEQCNYPDCKCPTENPCLKGLAQPEQEPVACAECERLSGELKKANDQAEHFEREWYLRGFEIERLEAQPQEPVGVVHHKLTSTLGADYEQVAVFVRPLEPGTKLYTAVTTPPHRTEQDFCSRCGKRTTDLTTIHTCTPPQENT